MANKLEPGTLDWKALMAEVRGSADKYLEQNHLIDISNKNTKYYVHYTSLETLFGMMNNWPVEGQRSEANNTGLRCYDISATNDPHEGRPFLDAIKKEYSWFEEKPYIRENPPFSCSFIEGKENIRDKLMYWQSYGQDGLGCSIALPQKNIDLLPMYKVHYCTNELEKYIQTFRGNFQSYQGYHDTMVSEKNKPIFTEEILEQFGMLQFLYKRSAYKDEKECRILIPYPQDSEEESRIIYDYKPAIPYLRRYIYKNFLKTDEILKSDNIVTIGPRVPDKERVKALLEQLAEERELYGPTFEVSSIPYRKLW